jgi:hypothetical protein
MKYKILTLALFMPLLGLSQTQGKKKAQPADTIKNIKLEEVVIKSKRPLIQMELDKTIVNVSSMISSASSNTLEVLEKTPGIVVDVNGNISLNGRSGVMVLIDGRQNYLSGPDLASYLKSLPGASLDKIELMDNPPARYDAAGNGVINIRLKKNRVGGFTGFASLGLIQGRLSNNNQALNLNYNYKKINIFSNLSLSKDQNYNTDQYNRNFYNNAAELSSKVLLNNEQEHQSRAGNLNLGIDYTLSERTTLGLQTNININKKQGILYSFSENYRRTDLDSTGTGQTDHESKRYNLTGNLTLVHKFGKSGRELSADAGYLRYTNNGAAWLENSIFQPNGSLLHSDQFVYDLPSTMQVYSMKTDYMHPLQKGGNLEAGLKFSRAENENQSDYYQLMDQEKTIDNSRSNHFVYKEDYVAAYLSGQKSWKQWGLKAGLRGEYTHANGRQMGNAEVSGSSFEKGYLKLFPSVFINYKMDTLSKNSFVFSLTRRINRPNYQQLNPFSFYIDQYSRRIGNPELNPQYQYRYELKYQHRQLLRVSLSYNHFSSVIFETTNVVDGIFISGPENVTKGFMLLLNTGLSLEPAKWWNLNTDVLLSRMGLNGQSYGQALKPKTYVARINLMNQFKLEKGWSAELSGYYASTDLNGQTFTRGMFRANTGIQKKILKDKASIRLSMDDIFHSWVYHNRSISLKQAYAEQIRESDTQRIGLAFTYSFGSKTFARKSKQRDNALGEEQSRM